MWCMRQIKWPLSGQGNAAQQIPNANALQGFSLLEQSHSGRGSQEEGCGFVFFCRNGFHGLNHAGVHCTPGFIVALLAKLHV